MTNSSSAVCLPEKERLRIQTRHRVAIERHGYTPHALFWQDKEVQQIRFQVLAEGVMGIEGIKGCDQSLPEKLSILDVGCGFGDLYPFLKQKTEAGEWPDFQYLGIDVSPDMVFSGRCQYPGIEMAEGDVFDLNPAPQSFDWVMLSGALNEVFEGSGRYAKRVIERIYATSRLGVAFNLLDARNDWVASRPDLQSFHPDEMAQFCQTFADRVEVRTGYLDNDFTIYLYRSPSD